MSLDNNFVPVLPRLNKAICKQEIPVLRMAIAQQMALLFEQKKHSVIIVLQGMDASGKDGLIERNILPINPMFYSVADFKKPTQEELEHDFLWRVHPHCPPMGKCAFFNRSHYEDYLVPSVHKTLSKQQLKNRIESINQFEKHLLRERTKILKFFLNISHKRQGEKLLERQNNPEKQHKFKPSDITSRKKWKEFQSSYAYVFKHCTVGGAWKNIPADKKWQKDFIFLQSFTNYLAQLI